MQISLITIVLAVGILSGCSNTDTDGQKQTTLTPETVVQKTATDAEEGPTLLLTSNDQMQYDKKELRVKAGQTITLTLSHTGTMAKDVMGHNFVLLTKGTNLAEFANQAMAAKDNGYIPAGTNRVIAHTKLIGGGEATTLTFTAPEKGVYDYICSFPGHYALMQGKMIVE